ncbi:MAG TPA: response regulator [Thermoanaerobaculia bacterium]|nr:response regulator [Thermoanaerobaculia bacterium]
METSSQRSREEHVLVADDDPAIRRALTTVLEKAGLFVTAVSDGADAVAEMENAVFEVLVLDLVMPRVTGWQVIEWITAHPAHKPRVVIVLTASDRKILYELDPEAVNAILFKPFDIQELAGYVAACCRGLRTIATPPTDTV